MNTPATIWIAFDGTTKISQGIPNQVAIDVKAYVDNNPLSKVLAFDATTSQQLDMDAPGSLLVALHSQPAEKFIVEPDISNQQANPTKSVGRPKLGVTAKEVTLLPRHWEWLSTQPGGASVALRKLVEQAQRANKDTDRMRVARDAAYKFMNAMAGNESGFEEATRALFAGDSSRLRNLTEAWPQDVREHSLSLAEASLTKTIEY